MPVSKQLLFLTAFTAISPSLTYEYGINLIKIPSEDRSLVICAMALLRKYFSSGEPLSGSLLSMSVTAASMHIQQSLLHAIHSDDTYPWSVVLKNPHRETPITSLVLHEKPQCYFVIVENLEDEDLEDIFADWRTTMNWNPLAQFVVYLASVEETDDEMTELMVEILLNFMNKKIFNVNVIGQNEENGFYYGKTVFPYHPDNNCGNRVIAIETLDICDYQENEKEEEGDADQDGNDYDEEEKDEEEGGDNKGNGADDNEEGIDDKAAADEREEGSDDRKENSDENDKNEGGNAENPEDNNEDVDDTGEDGENKDNKGIDDDSEKGTDANEGNAGVNEDAKGIEKDDADFNEAGSDIGGEGLDVNESGGNDNEGGSDVGEENLDVNKDGIDLNEEGADANAEGGDADVDEEDANFNEEGANDNQKVAGVHEDGAYNKMKISDNNGEGSETYENDAGNEESAEDIIKDSDDDDKEQEEIRVVGSKIKSNDSDENTKREQDEEDEIRNMSEEKIKLSFESTAESNENYEKNKNYPALNQKKKYKIRRRMKRQLMSDEEESNVAESSSKIYLEELRPALFLDKFPKDLSGCPLLAAYRPWEPYIFTEGTQQIGENYDTNTSETGNADEPNINDEYESGVDGTDNAGLCKSFSGIEYEMVQTIAEHLHITIDIQVENNNLYHLLQQLIDGDIEMVVGGMDEDPSISQYVSSSIPYHQDDLTLCVAKAKRTYSLFNFLASFRMATWILTFTCVIVTAMTIIYIQKISKVKIPYLQGFFKVTTHIYGVLFSQSIQLKSLTSALKICLGTAFFMGLMFSNVYHSFLISTLTTPKSSYQISHLDEIYRHRMSIMGSVENVRHLNKDGEIFKYLREKFEMCYDIEECLMRAANDDRIAVAVSRQHSFYNPRIPRDQLYCFDRDENIYVYLVTLLLPKKFHLLHKINPIIQHVIESGHMQKWARDLDMKRKIKEEVNRVREQPVKRLTLTEVGGSFVFTAILLLFASLVFATECLVHWMATKRKTRLKLVKMLHRRFKGMP